MKEKLNLGCGREILEDYVNLDMIQLEGIDIEIYNGTSRKCSENIRRIVENQ